MNNCSVCGLNFQRKDKGCQKQECSQCKLRYHRYCYGFNNLEQICDPCSDGAKKAQCLICGQKGLLKRISDQKGVYVHISCAIFCGSIEVISYHTMTLATKSQQDKKSKEKCSNCGKSGANVQCLDCQAHAHPHCIYQEQVEKAEEDIETEQWIFRLKVERQYQDPNLLDVGVQEIKLEIKELQEAFLTALEKLKKRNLKEQVKQSIEQIFENYSIPQGQNIWNASQNKIESYCQVHMENHRLFCECRKSLNNKQMVQCDYCYEWYHFACIKQKKIKKDDSYVCDACQIWQDRRNKLHIENPKQLLPLEDIVIPNTVYILHLIDFIPLLLYIEAISKKLPSMPLQDLDFRTLKFYKLFLASLPIKPSSVIQLDKILLKEKIQEELKQKMQNIIPQLLSNNQQFASELVKQFEQRGYYFELDENHLIKSYIISRKELRIMLQQGIKDGYLPEDAIQLIQEQEIDSQKILRSPSDALLRCMHAYKVTQLLKFQIKQLFEYEIIHTEHPKFNCQLELTQYKQQQLLMNQKKKPHKLILLDIKKQANMNNVTFSSLQYIEQLIEEINTLENQEILYKQIIEFPINSNIIEEKLQNYFEKEFIEEFKVELEFKIEEKEPLTEKEYHGLYNLDNISKAAKESSVIKPQYQQLLDLQHKCQTIKKITPEFCNEILGQINQSLLTTPYIQQQKIKYIKFEELNAKLNESLTIEELEDIEHQCFQYGFEMNFQTRIEQLKQAEQILNTSSLNLDDNLDYFKSLKSKPLDNKIQSIEQQIQFIQQLYKLQYNKLDDLNVMINKISDIDKLNPYDELLKNIVIPNEICEQLQPIVFKFRQQYWRYQCTQILDTQNKYNMNEINLLLKQDKNIQDPEYSEELQEIKEEYDQWVNQFEEFKNSINQPDPSMLSSLIKLINKNKFDDQNTQIQLWRYYILLLWIQKADEFLTQKATVSALKVLLNSANFSQIDQNNYYYRTIQQTILLIEDLNKKLKEYQEQRSIWIKTKDQVNNLKSHKQFYRFLEQKPEAEKINEIYLQAKDYPQFQLKYLKEDLQEVKVVLQQYNELVIKEPDNNQYIQQLQRLRICYCSCFLKVKQFSIQLMYNIIKQQSLKCLKQLTPSADVSERLEEVNLIFELGGDEWNQKYLQTFKNSQQTQLNEEFKFIDASLKDDFEWIKWMEETNEERHIFQKKINKEQKIKKKQSSEKKDSIKEDQRQNARNDLFALFKKYNNWKNIQEQQVRNLEAQVFLEFNSNKDKYLSQIDRIKHVIKQNKQIELNYEEFKKSYKSLSKKPSNNGTKLTSQLECIKVVKKSSLQQQQQQQPQSQNQLPSIKQIPSQPTIKSEPDLEKRTKIEKQPTIIAQPIINIQTEAVMYNPDENSGLENIDYRRKKELMTLGEIQLQIKRRNGDQRTPFLIKPELYTYEHRYAHLFPKTDQCVVTCESFSPVKDVVEYLIKRDQSLKMIVGWLYSKDIKVAADLFKLADKLKHQKQCVGLNHDDFGFTLIYYEYLSKLKPTTKWIVCQEMLQSDEMMNKLSKFHNLEKFKPHLCFVYYLKDNKEHPNTILPQPVKYINVYKSPQLSKIIDEHKLQKKQQQQIQQGTQQSTKSRQLEPISDEENQPPPHEDVKQLMLDLVPDITNLLG